jgi:aspartate/methionine/tyrosine aminotransferase
MTDLNLSYRLGQNVASVYSALSQKLADFKGEIYPLHVGDTYKSPAFAVQDLGQISDSNRYTVVAGMNALRKQAASFLSIRQKQEVLPSEILITGGGTGGLTALLLSLLTQDDELMILAPFWPLVKGAAQLIGAKPVIVPFFGLNLDDEQAVDALNQLKTPKTKAIYINHPNNPTGELISKTQLQKIISWAKDHKIWVISDEVYDLFVYEGEHVYARTLEQENVIALYSLSKAFGMAGYRCAFLQGPKWVIDHTERMLTFSQYSAPTPAQYVGLQVLSDQGLAWADQAKNEYQQTAQACAQILGVPPPKSGTFLFVDVGDYLRDKTLDQLLNACADQGLLVAPGTSFGPYPQSIRLCFTAVSPEVAIRGVRILAHILGKDQSC